LRDDNGTTIEPITQEYNLKQKEKMIHDLLNYETVIRLLCGAYYNQYTFGPYDYIFNCLNFKMCPLSQESEDFNIIKDYIISGLDDSISSRDRIYYYYNSN